MRGCIPIAGAVMMITAPAFAHEGSRIWINSFDGKIVTLKADDDSEPTIYTPSRIFEGELGNFSGIFQTDFPGYEVVQSGVNVGSGTTFGFNIAGPLLVYDTTLDLFRSTQSKYGPPLPGPVPQMAVSLDVEFRETSHRKVPGFNFFTYTGTGAHGHVAYTMLPVDPPFNPPAGVYALPMTLTSSSLLESDPYFILLGKGVSPGSALFNEAHEVMQAMLDLPGDTNFDGVVNATDLTAMAQHWQGTGTWADGDLNFDSIVDVRDLMILANHWFQGSANLATTPISIPEPGAGIVLALLPILSRRRW